MTGIISTRTLVLALLATSGLWACGDDDGTIEHHQRGGGSHGSKNGDSSGPNKAPTKAGGSESSGYEEQDSVANAGTITGTVTYTGSRTAGTIEVTKDPNVCTHGGQSDRTIVVADGKLANAIIYLVDVPRGKKWPADPPALDNKECEFDPYVLVGHYRGDLAITNSDPVLHNTNLFLHDGNRTLANVSLPRQGQTVATRLRKEGIVEAKCDVHPWMRAHILSSPHPYAAVSGADGTFTIDGVPPGTYQVKVWHEVFGEKQMSVTVAANGSATLNVAFE